MLVNILNLRSLIQETSNEEDVVFISNVSYVLSVGKFSLYEDVCCFINTEYQLEKTVLSLKNVDNLFSGEGVIRTMESWYSLYIKYLENVFSNISVPFDKQAFELTVDEVNSYRTAIRNKDFLTILKISIKRYYRGMQSIKGLNDPLLTTINYKTKSLLEKAIYS